MFLKPIAQLINSLFFPFIYLGLFSVGLNFIMAKLTPRKKDKTNVRVIPIIKPAFFEPIFKFLEKNKKEEVKNKIFSSY